MSATKFTLRIPIDILNMVDEKAKNERRSRNNLIVHMLAKGVGVKILKSPLPPGEG